MQIMNNAPETYAWKLKHELIFKSIHEKGDYKLAEINRKVAEILKAKEDDEKSTLR